MSDKIDISIIVPIYNTKEEYFKECMKSLLNQQGNQKIQIILIDTSDTDVKYICDEYAKIYDNVKVVHRLPEGVSVSRNEGINLAEGEFLIFVDSDDWIEPQACELICNKMREKELDLLTFAHADQCPEGISVIKNNISEDYIYVNRDMIKNIQLGLMDISKRQFQNMMGSSCVLGYRTNWLKRCNVKFHPDLIRGEDMFFVMQLLDFPCNYGIIDEVLYNYRKNISSVTYKYNPDMKEKCLTICEILNSYIKDKHNDKDYFDSFACLAVKLYIHALKLSNFHPDCEMTYSKARDEWKKWTYGTNYITLIKEIDIIKLWKKSRNYAVVAIIIRYLHSYAVISLLFKQKLKN